jgi:hypothetical protein
MMSSSTSTDWRGRNRSIGRSSARKPTTRRGAFHAILALYLVFCAVAATLTAQALHARAGAAPLASHLVPPTPKYLVLMVLDGARPDYFGLTSLPHVDALRASGTQFTNAWDAILESETPAGHATIATGSPPSRNGIIGFNWGQNGGNYSIFDPDVVRSGVMEQIMERSKVSTIAGLYKRQYPGSTVVALSGHKYYAADPMGGPDADAIMYYQGDPQGRYVPVAIPGHVPPSGVLSAPGVVYPTSHRVPPGVEDNLATRLAIATFHHMHQRITMINYPEFDWPLGHVQGGNIDPTRVITLMKSFDHDLGQIENAYRKAGILDKTLFVITADHGMEPIQHFISPSVISAAVSAAGTTAPSTASSTGEYMWLADASKAQAVAQNLVASKDPGIQSAYYLDSSPSPHYVSAGGSFVSPTVDRANLYMLSTLLGAHPPDVVSFAKSGYSFSTTTSWKGDHGGSTWQSQHIPMIFSGPGVRQRFISAEPAELQDLAPTILQVMGVQPQGMEGHVLTEVMMSPPGTLTHLRNKEIAHDAPLTSALVAQDNYEQSRK